VASAAPPKPTPRVGGLTLPEAEALLSVAHAFPSLTPAAAVALAKQAVGSSPISSCTHKYPANTTPGPSRKAIILQIPGVKDFSLPSLVPHIHSGLLSVGSLLTVESFWLAYGSLLITTTTVPTPANLDTISNAAHPHVPGGLKVLCEVPSSRSFLHIHAVPFFLGEGRHYSPEDALRDFSSSVHSDFFWLAAPPRIVRDSRRADTCCIYFNIWDSQSGSRSRHLSDRSISMAGVAWTISSACVNTGVPFCT